MVIAFLLCILSVFTFILFAADKRRAVAHKWRISERMLLCFSFFGGIGGLLGMIFFHHKTRKWRFKILVPLFAFVDATVIAFFLWSSVYYAADISAESAMISDDTVTVEKTEAGWLFDGPSDEKALIFYPGAKVDETAYAPMLRKIAEVRQERLLTILLTSSTTWQDIPSEARWLRNMLRNMRAISTGLFCSAHIPRRRRISILFLFMDRKTEFLTGSAWKMRLHWYREDYVNL